MLESAQKAGEMELVAFLEEVLGVYEKHNQRTHCMEKALMITPRKHVENKWFGLVKIMLLGPKSPAHLDLRSFAREYWSDHQLG